ncbi:NAD(P)-binding protein [Massilia sp. W12]|uniref:oxidoreductase n=1 Tax=Massilia sp. W12 TaxID=3126507 RepID=UPI0030D4C839
MSAYDILFEPVKIGPVTSKNRFYQVPHCNGMGHRYPSSLAQMRKIKAEGGWGVICTEEVEISPRSEIAPYNEGRIWDEADLPALQKMTDACHAHGALAGIEIMFNGYATANLYSRITPLAPSNLPVRSGDPLQARAASKSDIAEVRRLHRQACLRAMQAGFDLVYVYAGHDLGMPLHFLSRHTNFRSDEYGGSLENRVRLLRELIEDAKDAVGHRCGVVVRLALDQLLGPQGITSAAEGRDVIAMLAELPDLWDVNIADWSNDSQTARFAAEGYQESYLQGIKALTSKPVVGVGRYTSPDAMVSAIKRGLMDMIGAARPSIADPFLPHKIQAGRLEDIRECIGCNICVSGDNACVPIRCTQNPTMGEEWRRGWHPEFIPPRASSARVLVVGAGPAGLEAARALGQRGYQVALAERDAELGGRVRREARLPGLASWMRVADYRLQQLRQMPNVDLYPGNDLSAQDILDFGFEQVILATGSHWRRDGFGRSHRAPLAQGEWAQIFTPDDILAGRLPTGPVLVYDDDNYYMGGVLAEFLRKQGLPVHYMTPAAKVSEWTEQTMEQARIHRRLHELGVEISVSRLLQSVTQDGPGLRLQSACAYTGELREQHVSALLLLTMREPQDALAQALAARASDWAGSGIQAVQTIGDAYAPATIAAAVYAGHKAAREMDAPESGDVPFKREVVQLARE